MVWGYYTGEEPIYIEQKMIQCIYFVKGGIALIKTLTKHGNSLALIIDKPILELLEMDADTPISISTDGKVLVLSPVRDMQREEKLMRIRERVNKKYAGALKNLAN